MKLSPGLAVFVIAVVVAAMFLLAEWAGVAAQIRGQ